MCDASISFSLALNCECRATGLGNSTFRSGCAMQDGDRVLSEVDHPALTIDRPDLGIGIGRSGTQQRILNAVGVVGYESVVSPNPFMRSPDLNLRVGG